MNDMLSSTAASNAARPLLNSRLADIEMQLSSVANTILGAFERLYGTLAVDPMPPPAPVDGGQIGEAHGQINTISSILQQLNSVACEFSKKASS